MESNHDTTYLSATNMELLKSHKAAVWMRGRTVAKCDPLLSRAIQHDAQSRPMGDPALDKWGHD